MGDKTKKFSKYFGGIYMKYWYAAFAVTVILMAVFYVADRNIKTYTYTMYDDNGTALYTEDISADETAIKAREWHSRSLVPHKLF